MADKWEGRILGWYSNFQFKSALQLMTIFLCFPRGNFTNVKDLFDLDFVSTDK